MPRFLSQGGLVDGSPVNHVTDLVPRGLCGGYTGLYKDVGLHSHIAPILENP